MRGRADTTRIVGGCRWLERLCPWLLRQRPPRVTVANVSSRARVRIRITRIY